VILPLFAGLLFSGVIGLLAYWRGSLSRSGVVGAVLTGTPIFAFWGIVWGGVLVAFFLSSSALSHYRARAKSLLAEKFQKGSRRDLGQALANGAWAAVLAAAFGEWHVQWLFVAFLGAISTVTADTWATELGVLSSKPPRLITTGRQVPVGTSGGVSALGTLTALLGASFVGVAGAALEATVTNIPWLRFGAEQYFGLPFKWITLIILAAVGGLVGSLFDSLLGATVQAMYFCELDQKETERRIHSCGRATHLVRGYRWLDNDVVNLCASVFGSGITVMLWLLIASWLPA
jgi:uncharacterized protein (TIGR00297 family)